jgi:hypothetical protein
MPNADHRRATRSVAAAVAALALCGLSVRLFVFAGAAALDAVGLAGPDAPGDLLVLGATAAGLLLVAWLLLGVVLGCLATVPGAAGRAAACVADRVTPALVRRATALLVGGVLVAGGTPLAHAASPSPSPSATRVLPAPAPDPGFHLPDAAPVVDAPVARADPPVRVPAPSSLPVPAPDPGFGSLGLGPLGPAPHPASPRSATVTVTRGDSLWAIAARHLGPTATRQEIAREWPRWYAANRAVIGPDPDLIRVGQVLTPPGATS